MQLRTSVVIVTRDRVALLLRSLSAVQRDPCTREIVVVDDASSDPTATLLRDRGRGDERLRIVRTTGVGPAAARQVGVEAATGALVVLLDDDVIAGPRLVGGHATALRGHPERVTLGYSPLPLPDSRAASDVARFAYARDYERRCRRYEADRAPVLHHLWGGNVGLWREAALTVGLASPALGDPRAYHEDRDFGLRAARAGLHGVFHRALAAEHHHHRSVRAALDDAARRGRGLVRLHELHGDLIGPYEPRALYDGLPAVVADCVRAAGRGRLERTLLAVTLAAIAASGRARRWEAQDAAFRLARRIGEQHGALQATGPSPSLPVRHLAFGPDAGP